jgi:hypothetical protein
MQLEQKTTMTDNSIPSDTMKDFILYSLRNFITTINFTKKDGTERTMRCTLMESVLPPRDPDTGVKAHSSDVQPVWDVEAQGWRSFRWDSVNSFTSLDADEANTNNQMWRTSDAE